MIVVLGSGFGLYGHVAALAGAGRPVATPARYRERAVARPELAGFVDGIAWVADEWSAIAGAQVTTLACRPAETLALAERMIGEDIGGTLVLEKPIAPTWQAAQVLEQAMLAAGRVWHTPYLFLYCDWFDLLADGLARGERVAVRWRHRQAPGVNSWKTAGDEGGGAVSFYFIHWLAALEALMPGVPAQYSNTRIGDVEHTALRAIDGAAELDVAFELGSDLGFEIFVDGQSVHQALTPFGALPERGLPDPRIPMLQRFYEAVLSGDSRYDSDFQMAVTQRWRSACND